VQRADRPPGSQLIVGACGILQRLLGGQRDNGIDLRVDRLDPVQVCPYNLAGRQLLATKLIGQLPRGQIADLGFHSITVARRSQPKVDADHLLQMG
jgi:hypothetical protein